MNNPTEKIPLARNKGTWGDSITSIMDLKETGTNTCSGLVALDNSCECGIEPPDYIGNGVI